MTPTFMGSEPIRAEAGKYAGTDGLQDEQDKGLALMQALTPEQQKKATLQPEKTANNALAQAFRDNLVLDYAGLKASELNDAQRAMLVDVIGEYVGNMSEGHAKVRMEEVKKHLAETYFAWVGGDGQRRGLLLPHPEPGHPDRVRSPDAGRAAGPEGARPHPRPHRRPDAERQRLRQGSPAPALRAAQARSVARPRAMTP